MNTHKIIRGHKQPKSLKRILTKAALLPKATETKVSKCGRSNRATCPNLLEGSTFIFKEGQNFKVKSNFTCASENLIYVITCMGCQQKYIGSTSLTLRRRCTLHRQQIASPEYRMIPLSGHIENCAQNFKPQFLIFPFFQLAHNTSRQFRLNKENFFIEKYTPKLNHYHHRPWKKRWKQSPLCQIYIYVQIFFSYLHWEINLFPLKILIIITTISRYKVIPPVQEKSPTTGYYLPLQWTLLLK